MTRTTLETDESLSLPTVAGLLQALRHVPGVLLADISAGGRSAVVAHDAAVPRASLLAAAEGAGVHARIFRDDRPSVSTAVVAPFASVNGPLAILAQVLLIVALVYVVDPRLFGTSFLPIVLAAVWGCVIARAILGRRK